MTMNRKPTRMRSVLALLMLAVLASALGTLGGTSAAFAAPQPAASVTHEIRLGMYVGGFDATVAKAHGYKIVTYANGDRQSVPIDPKSTRPKGPILRAQSVSRNSTVAPSQGVAPAASNTDYNEVWGNCGRSWIRVTQTGTNKVSVVSGFSNLPEIADYWSWNVLLSDRNGVSHQTYSGAIFSTSASRIWSNLNQYGYTFDYVYSGIAFLLDGTICYSGSPDVSISL